MDISVEKITLKLGKKTIELSVEDARKLKSALDSVLGGYTYTYTSPQVWYSVSGTKTSKDVTHTKDNISATITI